MSTQWRGPNVWRRMSAAMAAYAKSPCSRFFATVRCWLAGHKWEFADYRGRYEFKRCIRCHEFGYTTMEERQAGYRGEAPQ